MAIVNITGNIQSNAYRDGAVGTVKYTPSTVTLTASNSINSTFTLARLPSDARIVGISMIDITDSTSTGATLDIGLFPLEDQYTESDDCIASGIDLSSAVSGRLLTSLDSITKSAYELLGATENKGGLLDVKATLKGAAIVADATLTLQLFYTIGE